MYRLSMHPERLRISRPAHRPRHRHWGTEGQTKTWSKVREDREVTGKVKVLVVMHEQEDSNYEKCTSDANDICGKWQLCRLCESSSKHSMVVLKNILRS